MMTIKNMFALVLFLLVVPAAGQNSIACSGDDIMQVTPMPARAFYLEREGDIAIAAGDDGAQIYRLDTDLRPTVISQIPASDGPVGPQALEDNVVYLNWGNTLYVYDIHDPADPVKVGQYEFSNRVRHMDVDSGIVFVSFDEDVFILDTQDPGKPNLVAMIDTMEGARDIAVDSEVLYIAQGGDGILIVDVADPAIPIELGRYQIPAYGRIHIHGDMMLVEGGGLAILDISKPSSPVFLGRYSGEDFFSVDVVHSTVYLSDGFFVDVVDISDPTTPRRLGWYDIPGWVGGFVVQSDVMLVIDGGNRLLNLDVSDPKDPQPLYVMGPDLLPLGVPHEMYTFGQTGFFTDGSTEYVADISDPSSPGPFVELTFASLSGVYVRENVLMGLTSTAIGAYDFTDPYKPAKLDFARLAGFADGGSVVAFDDATACVSSGRGELFGVTDLTDIVSIGQSELLADAAALVIAGDYVYGSFHHGYLACVDISDPSNLGLVWELDETEARHLLIQDQYLVSGDGQGVVLIDISDPRSPVVISNIRIQDEIESIHVDDGKLAITLYDMGLVVYDISDLNSPRFIGAYSPRVSGLTPGFSGASCTISGDVAFYLDANQGLITLDISEPCQVCEADVDGDGELTPDDLTAWINAFNNNLPECDQNGDGSCTPTDFTAWISNFNAGCP